MELCKLKIGPRDPSLPATFLNAKIEINGREVKVYTLDISLKGDDPEDPIAIIELPVDLGVDMQVQATTNRPVRPAKPKPPEVKEPCSSCGTETMHRQDRATIRGEHGSPDKIYCGSCGVKAQAIADGKTAIKPASKVHGTCVESYEDDPDEQP